MLTIVILTVANVLLTLFAFYGAHKSAKSADLSHDFSKNAADFTRHGQYHAERAERAASRASIERSVAEECVQTATEAPPENPS